MRYGRRHSFFDGSCLRVLKSSVCPATDPFPASSHSHRKVAAMPDQNNNRESPNRDRTAKVLAKKVETIQKRAYREGFVSGALSDKPMMD